MADFVFGKRAANYVPNKIACEVHGLAGGWMGAARTRETVRAATVNPFTSTQTLDRLGAGPSTCS